MSTSNEDIQKIQIALTQKILTSIKTFGLLGRNERAKNKLFSVNSADGDEGHHMVCINEIQFHAWGIESFQRMSKLALMTLKQDVGMWSIALERTYKLPGSTDKAQDKEALQAELRERLQKTMVLILKPQQPTPTKQDEITRFGYTVTEGVAESFMLNEYSKSEDPPKRSEAAEIRVALPVPDFYECRINRTVNFDQVLAILVPEQLYALVKAAYPGIKLYPVKDTGAKLDVAFPGLETQKYYPQTFQKWKRAEVSAVPIKLSGPNYVEAFESFCDDPSNGDYCSHFACHVVKFPTVAGIKLGLDQKLPQFLAAKQSLDQELKEKKEKTETKEKVEVIQLGKQPPAAPLAFAQFALRTNAATTVQRHYRVHRAKKEYEAERTRVQASVQECLSKSQFSQAQHLIAGLEKKWREFMDVAPQFGYCAIRNKQ